MINELYCNPPRNRFINSVIYREQYVSILITKCGAVRIIVTSVDDCSVSILRHLKLSSFKGRGQEFMKNRHIANIMI